MSHFGRFSSFNRTKGWRRARATPLTIFWMSRWRRARALSENSQNWGCVTFCGFPHKKGAGEYLEIPIFRCQGKKPTNLGPQILGCTDKITVEKVASRPPRGPDRSSRFDGRLFFWPKEKERRPLLAQERERKPNFHTHMRKKTTTFKPSRF